MNLLCRREVTCFREVSFLRGDIVETRLKSAARRTLVEMRQFDPGTSIAAAPVQCRRSASHLLPRHGRADACPPYTGE